MAAPFFPFTEKWVECWQCGGQGFLDGFHEVDPLWYDEDYTEECDICNGAGGWESVAEEAS